MSRSLRTIIIITAGLIAVIAAVYFFVLPRFDYAAAAWEAGGNWTIYFRFAFSGYRFCRTVIPSAVLDDTAGINATLNSFCGRALMLSPAVSGFALAAGWEPPENGPVVLGVSSEESVPWDIRFTYDALSGWEQVPQALRGPALILDTGIPGLGTLFADSPLYAIHETGQTDRDPDNAAAAAALIGARYICCPYIPDIYNYIDKMGEVKWIVDESLLGLMNEDFLGGAVVTDIYSSVRELLISGLRNLPVTLVLPLRRMLILY